MTQPETQSTLSPATVLITGCSTGFGRLAALRFARAGDRVFATMRTPAAGQDLVDTAAAEGLALDVVALDVCDQKSVDNAVAHIAEATGESDAGIDVLINNAGVPGRGPVEDIFEDDMRRIMETNFFGAVRMMRAVLPGMRRKGGGVIVNVTSIAGITGSPGAAFYSAGKYALEGLTEAMSYEVEPFGVRMALVEPGYYRTNIGSTLLATDTYPADSPYREFMERWRMGGIDAVAKGGDPEEVVDAIVDAVRGSSPRFRYALGPMADAVVNGKKTLSDDQMRQVVKQTLGFES